MYTTKTVQRCA